jgi:uncharacterized membrane protein
MKYTRSRARRHIALALFLGIAIGLIATQLTKQRFAPSLGWDAGALAYLLLTWRDIWRLDATGTQTVAEAQDSSTVLDDVLLILAALVSLITVALVLSHSNTYGTAEQLLRTGVGIVSVVLAWAVLHTVYTLRYAKLYYRPPVGGIDFNTTDLPAYSDFAYLAFGIGMAFQVADTNVRTNIFRKTVLRHALLSFLFATTILAVTINLVASLNS